MDRLTRRITRPWQVSQIHRLVCSDASQR